MRAGMWTKYTVPLSAATEGDATTDASAAKTLQQHRTQQMVHRVVDWDVDLTPNPLWRKWMQANLQQWVNVLHGIMSADPKEKLHIAKSASIVSFPMVVTEHTRARQPPSVTESQKEPSVPQIVCTASTVLHAQVARQYRLRLRRVLQEGHEEKVWGVLQDWGYLCGWLRSSRTTGEWFPSDAAQSVTRVLETYKRFAKKGDAVMESEHVHAETLASRWLSSVWPKSTHEDVRAHMVARVVDQWFLPVADTMSGVPYPIEDVSGSRLVLWHRKGVPQVGVGWQVWTGWLKGTAPPESFRVSVSIRSRSGKQVCTMRCIPHAWTGPTGEQPFPPRSVRNDFSSGATREWTNNMKMAASSVMWVPPRSAGAIFLKALEEEPEDTQPYIHVVVAVDGVQEEFTHACEWNADLPRIPEERAYEETDMMEGTAIEKLKEVIRMANDNHDDEEVEEEEEVGDGEEAAADAVAGEDTASNAHAVTLVEAVQATTNPHSASFGVLKAWFHLDRAKGADNKRFGVIENVFRTFPAAQTWWTSQGTKPLGDVVTTRKIKIATDVGNELVWKYAMYLNGMVQDGNVSPLQLPIYVWELARPLVMMWEIIHEKTVATLPSSLLWAWGVELMRNDAWAPYMRNGVVTTTLRNVCMAAMKQLDNTELSKEKWITGASEKVDGGRIQVLLLSCAFKALLQMAYTFQLSTTDSKTAVWDKLPDVPGRTNPTDLLCIDALKGGSRTLEDSKTWMQRVLKLHPNTPVDKSSLTDVANDASLHRVMKQTQLAREVRSVDTASLRAAPSGSWAWDPWSGSDTAMDSVHASWAANMDAVQALSSASSAGDGGSEAPAAAEPAELLKMEEKGDATTRAEGQMQKMYDFCFPDATSSSASSSGDAQLTSSWGVLSKSSDVVCSMTFGEFEVMDGETKRYVPRRAYTEDVVFNTLAQVSKFGNMDSDAFATFARERDAFKEALTTEEPGLSGLEQEQRLGQWGVAKLMSSTLPKHHNKLMALKHAMQQWKSVSPSMTMDTMHGLMPLMMRIVDLLTSILDDVATDAEDVRELVSSVLRKVMENNEGQAQMNTKLNDALQNRLKAMVGLQGAEGALGKDSVVVKGLRMLGLCRPADGGSGTEEAARLLAEAEFKDAEDEAKQAAEEDERRAEQGDALENRTLYVTLHVVAEILGRSFQMEKKQSQATDRYLGLHKEGGSVFTVQTWLQALMAYRTQMTALIMRGLQISRGTFRNQVPMAVGWMKDTFFAEDAKSRAITMGMLSTGYKSLLSTATVLHPTFMDLFETVAAARHTQLGAQGGTWMDAVKSAWGSVKSSVKSVVSGAWNMLSGSVLTLTMLEHMIHSVSTLWNQFMCILLKIMLFGAAKTLASIWSQITGLLGSIWSGVSAAWTSMLSWWSHDEAGDWDDGTDTSSTPNQEDGTLVGVIMKHISTFVSNIVSTLGQMFGFITTTSFAFLSWPVYVLRQLAFFVNDDAMACVMRYLQGFLTLARQLKYLLNSGFLSVILASLLSTVLYQAFRMAVQRTNEVVHHTQDYVRRMRRSLYRDLAMQAKAAGWLSTAIPEDADVGARALEQQLRAVAEVRTRMSGAQDTLKILRKDMEAVHAYGEAFAQQFVQELDTYLGKDAAPVAGRVAPLENMASDEDVRFMDKMSHRFGTTLTREVMTSFLQGAHALSSARGLTTLEQKRWKAARETWMDVSSLLKNTSHRVRFRRLMWNTKVIGSIQRGGGQVPEGAARYTTGVSGDGGEEEGEGGFFNRILQGFQGLMRVGEAMIETQTGEEMKDTVEESIDRSKVLSVLRSHIMMGFAWWVANVGLGSVLDVFRPMPFHVSTAKEVPTGKDAARLGLVAPADVYVSWTEQRERYETDYVPGTERMVYPESAAEDQGTITQRSAPPPTATPDGVDMWRTYARRLDAAAGWIGQPHHILPNGRRVHTDVLSSAPLVMQVLSNVNVSATKLYAPSRGNQTLTDLLNWLVQPVWAFAKQSDAERNAEEVVSMWGTSFVSPSQQVLQMHVDVHATITGVLRSNTMTGNFITSWTTLIQNIKAGGAANRLRTARDALLNQDEAWVQAWVKNVRTSSGEGDADAVMKKTMSDGTTGTDAVLNQIMRERTSEWNAALNVEGGSLFESFKTLWTSMISASRSIQASREAALKEAWGGVKDTLSSSVSVILKDASKSFTMEDTDAEELSANDMAALSGMMAEIVRGALLSQPDSSLWRRFASGLSSLLSQGLYAIISVVKSVAVFMFRAVVDLPMWIGVSLTQAVSIMSGAGQWMGSLIGGSMQSIVSLMVGRLMFTAPSLNFIGLLSQKLIGLVPMQWSSSIAMTITTIINLASWIFTQFTATNGIMRKIDQALLAKEAGAGLTELLTSIQNSIASRDPDAQRKLNIMGRLGQWLIDRAQTASLTIAIKLTGAYRVLLFLHSLMSMMMSTSLVLLTGTIMLWGDEDMSADWRRFLLGALSGVVDADSTGIPNVPVVPATWAVTLMATPCMKGMVRDMIRSDPDVVMQTVSEDAVGEEEVLDDVLEEVNEDADAVTKQLKGEALLLNPGAKLEALVNRTAARLGWTLDTAAAAEGAPAEGAAGPMGRTVTTATVHESMREYMDRLPTALHTLLPSIPDTDAVRQTRTALLAGTTTIKATVAETEQHFKRWAMMEAQTARLARSGATYEKLVQTITNTWAEKASSTFENAKEKEEYQNWLKSKVGELQFSAEELSQRPPGLPLHTNLDILGQLLDSEDTSENMERLKVAARADLMRWCGNMTNVNRAGYAWWSSNMKTEDTNWWSDMRAQYGLDEGVGDREGTTVGGGGGGFFGGGVGDIFNNVYNTVSSIFF
jgi:hypothetical protein